MSDEAGNKKSNYILLPIITTFITILVMAGFIIFGVMQVKNVMNEMYDTYINNTRQVINSREEISAANVWERMPIKEQKEILRGRYYEIVKYYTTDIPENQKMNDKQIIETFDVLYNCINAVSPLNFFLPVSYLKVKTNFNPNYNQAWQYGIGAFYTKEGENISNLPVVKENQIFRIAYKGTTTLLNPIETIKLLVAKMDDLMRTFNNREDWVILSLLRNEYEVIEKWWEDGEGSIPNEFYEIGSLHDVLNYYYAFRNLKVIPIE